MNRATPTTSRLSIALARLDVIIVVGTFAILVVLFLIMLPSMHHHGGLSPRAICAANLKGIGTGFYTYANENNEMWPNCGPTLPEKDKPPIPVTYAPSIIGKNRDISDQAIIARAAKDQLRMSVTRNLWVLARMQASTQKSFICPSSKDKANEGSAPQNYWDFAKYSEVSYGCQVPFGRFGQPSVDCDQRMPLAADKGPYSAALEAGKPNPGIPTAGLTSTPQQWKRWNSLNHAGDGQNVLFADGHVDWAAKPIVGVGNDNMYTRWSDATGGAGATGDNPAVRIQGTPPTGTEVPMSNTETLIYP